MKVATITALAALIVTPPLLAEDPNRRERNERSERADRADRARSPYSNRAQFQRRQIRDAVREASREERGRYRFRALRKRRPE